MSRSYLEELGKVLSSLCVRFPKYPCLKNALYDICNAFSDMFGVLHDKSYHDIQLPCDYRLKTTLLRVSHKRKENQTGRGFAFDTLDTVDLSKSREFGWCS